MALATKAGYSAYYTLSGTLAAVVQSLNAERIRPENVIMGPRWDSTTGTYLAVYYRSVPRG